MLAVKGGSQRHNKCVQALLRYGADVNVQYPISKKTALHCAIELANFPGYTSLIRDLLDAGAAPNVKDSSGDFPLLPILYGGYEPPEKHKRDALACLLRLSFAAYVNVRSLGTGNTPLHLAVRRKDALAVGMLFHRKALVDEPNRAGITPLKLAATGWNDKVSDNQTEVLRILLRGDVNVNELSGEQGFTALHTAAFCGCESAIKLSLDKNADSWVKDSLGRTPCHVSGEAAEKMTLETNSNIMNMFLEAREVDYETVEGQCAIFTTVRNNSVEDVGILLKRGSRANHHDKTSSNTPLLQLALNTHYREMVYLLLDRGAYVDVKNESMIHLLNHEQGSTCIFNPVGLRLRCFLVYRDVFYMVLVHLSHALFNHVSVYKCFGARAVRFASQSPPDHLATASHTHGELDLRNEDDVASKIPNPSFHVVYLRDSCSCSRCIDPSTRQRLFETADIPDNIQCDISRRNSDGSVTVAWQNDIPGYENYRSTYNSQFITSSLTYPSRSSALYNCKQEAVLWDRNTMATHSTPTDYKTFIGSSAELYRALIALQNFGMIFLCNVPSQSDSIKPYWPNKKNHLRLHMGRAVGPISQIYCLYRDWFAFSHGEEIISDSFPIVAFNNNEFQDLLYIADPPELQILHCLRVSKQGGESLSSDTLRAVETMGQQRNPLLKTLAEFPVTYWYKNDGFNFLHTKRTIEMKLPLEDGMRRADFFSQIATTIKAVNWSLQFQAPLMFDIGDNESRSETGNSLSNYLASIKAFKRLIKDPASVFETRMEEGTCVIFNNRRIVHARRAFSDIEGNRWLRGAYVDKEERSAGTWV